MGKGRYLLKRFVYIVFVFFIISILMFAIYKSMPGNPVDIMLGDSKTSMKPDAYQALYDKTVKDLGLDKPLPVQYVAWMGNMLTGEFGYSTQYKQEVINIISAPMRNTVLLNILTMIAVSFGSALVPISAAAYGQGSYRRIREVYLFALKRGVAVMIAVAVLTEVAAPLLVTLFTYSESSAALADEMTHFLRICALFLPFYLIGVVTSSMFQSIGHGLWSLCVATLRNFMRIPLCFVLSFTMSLTMVWCGITLGEVIASSVVTVAGFMVLRRLRQELGDDSAAVTARSG